MDFLKKVLLSTSIILMTNAFYTLNFDDILFVDSDLKVSVLAATDYLETDYCQYYKNDNTVSISKWKNIHDKEIIIPDEIDGMPVTSIYGFSECSLLEKVTLGQNLTYIGSNAFEECISLEKVVLNKKIKGIGTKAFYECKNLKFLENTESLETIGTNAFWNCPKLVISNLISIKKIENGAFSYCDAITEVITGNQLTEIGDSAFKNCTNLGKIELSDSVSKIGRWAFYECSNLTSFVIPQKITVIQPETFRYCKKLSNVIFNDSLKEIGYASFQECPLKELKLGNNVVSIDGLAFDNAEFTEVILPDSVTKISGFYNCKNLETFTAGPYLTSISFAFSGCSNLKNVYLGESLKEIGQVAFAGCTSLESITLPDTVKEMGYYCFSGCTSLKSIIIPEKVEIIRDQCFKNCSSLEEITIPNSVSEIGKECFVGCTALKKLQIGKNIDGFNRQMLPAGSIIMDQLVLHVYENSKGLEWAKDNWQNYVIIDDVPSSEIVYGDINIDGKFDASDFIIMIKYLQNDDITLSAVQKQNADTNNDGVLNIFDLIRLKKLLLSIE